MPDLIFSVGPSNISERVREGLTRPDICHRDDEFRTLLAEIRNKLLRVAGVSPDQYSSILLSGSGSVSIEAAVSAVKPMGNLFVISNGVYGERAAGMAQSHGVAVREWRLNWGQPIDAEELDRKLSENPPSVVYVVHHETTTGRLNDIQAIAAVAKKHSCAVIVDAISSIGGEEIKIEGWGIDCLLGSGNKCLRGVPGVAFAIVRHSFVEKMEPSAYPRYADLLAHKEAEDQGSTPFTPTVQAHFAFLEALDETLEEGVQNRILHFSALSQQLSKGLETLGIKFVLPLEAYGNTLLSCYLPENTSFDELHADLKKLGYVIYGAQGELKHKAFRLGVIGHFGKPEVEGLLTALKTVLSKS